MKRILTYTITGLAAPVTIAAFLKQKGFSRRVLITLKEAPGQILKNGLSARADTRIQNGDQLTLSITEEDSSASIRPVPLPLSILYEDSDLMILNKEAGMPVHPSVGNHENTMANGLAWYFLQKKEPFVFRTVNRLDRDTSGLLLVAKHKLSASLLAKQAAEKRIRREYLAIVSGRPEDSGRIELPIGRKEGSVIERCIDPEGGDFAATRYCLLKYDRENDCSLISLLLETGRTHQIRVHMKAIGHPLLGDFLYYPDFRLIKRQALHSFRLSFIHPLSGANLSFEAPLPNDFTVLWNRDIPLYHSPFL